MGKNKVSRRDFLKKSGSGSVALTALTPGWALGKTASSQSAQLDRRALIAALGDTLIPSDPGDPGYRNLERYKITEEVMKGLTAIPDSELKAFNEGSAQFFAARNFLQLTEPQREMYLRLVIDGSKFTDKTHLRRLQIVYRQIRTRVFTVFYQNYPENIIPRDKNGTPVLKPGDKNQITNPNTEKIITGWDIAGYKGPMTWEEEQKRRAMFKKINWQE